MFDVFDQHSLTWACFMLKVVPSRCPLALTK